MKICPKCQCTTHDNFCVRCGSKNVELKKCKGKDCKRDIIPGWVVCPDCGLKVKE